MTDISTQSHESLTVELAKSREALRTFRFAGAGSRSRNVREGRTQRKQIARILTELRARALAKS